MQIAILLTQEKRRGMGYGSIKKAPKAFGANWGLMFDIMLNGRMRAGLVDCWLNQLGCVFYGDILVNLSVIPDSHPPQ